jgi:transposase
MDASSSTKWNPSAELTDAAPFACEYVRLSRQEHIQLVWEGRHWKRLHRSATLRLAEQEADYRRRLQSQSEGAEQREQALRRDLEYARGRIRDLEQRLFGRKSERRWVIDAQQPGSAASVRGRGQQRGAPGHGRKALRGLAIHDEILSMPSPNCPACGEALQDFPGTEDSEVLEIEVKATAESFGVGAIGRCAAADSCQGL